MYTGIYDLIECIEQIQVAASFSADGTFMRELKKWNDIYGEGGSRKLEYSHMTYYL